AALHHLTAAGELALEVLDAQVTAGLAAGLAGAGEHALVGGEDPRVGGEVLELLGPLDVDDARLAGHDAVLLIDVQQDGRAAGLIGGVEHRDVAVAEAAGVEPPLAFGLGGGPPGDVDSGLSGVGGHGLADRDGVGGLGHDAHSFRTDPDGGPAYLGITE